MRIVLVDPSRAVLADVACLLEARRHEVHAFDDGPAALDFLRSEAEVEALITSAELKSMSGLELCWEARLLAKRRPIYVLLMSSDREKHGLGEALDSGADDFISKPPAADELYARLRAAERLAAMQRDLIRMATTDSLTGVLNRRAFFEMASDAVAHASQEAPLSVIMFDIDHFKWVNDVHGHDAGDEVIRAVVTRAGEEGQVIGRLGGEEFAIILDRCTAAEAQDVAERLRRSVEALHFARGAEDLSVTCSFGVGQWQPGEDIDRLLKRADVALYAAKREGRNRVVMADDHLAMPDYEPRGRLIRGGRREKGEAVLVTSERPDGQSLRRSESE
ncbi:MAG TPA: diguanylate cyclase response regulator [Xanthobacteraceae bacterium]|jgi:diguanylate cyclase (GGDEF)-like protein|nr:diguanylate cyclase response regulator [Xanthobacteraceae bacterium]